MKDFDLWVYTTRKRRYFALTIEDDEIIETVMLEGENVSLIARLQESINVEPLADLQRQLFTAKSVDREPPPNT